MTRTQFCRRWIKLKPKQSRCLNNLGRDPWFSKMMMESISGHQGCTIYVRFCDIFAPTPWLHRPWHTTAAHCSEVKLIFPRKLVTLLNLEKVDLFCKPYDFAWLPNFAMPIANSKKKLRKIVKESYAFSLSTKHTPCPQGLVLQGLLFSVGSSWDTDTPTNIRPMAKRPKMWTLSKAITFRLPSSPTFNWKHRKRPHAHELLLPAVKVAERKVSSGATEAMTTKLY